MPVRDPLIGGAGADQHVFGKMGTDKLHAERHARGVKAVRKGEGWASAEVERRREAQDAKKNVGILAISLHEL